MGVSQVSSIQASLDKYWPSYDGANVDFWTHEYEKHGTCAESIAPCATELGFFSTTLSLTEKYNVVTMLASQGIVPGSADVATTKFEAAVSATFGGKPSLACSSKKLTTLGICFSPSLTPMDCPTPGTSCNAAFVFPATA